MRSGTRDKHPALPVLVLLMIACSSVPADAADPDLDGLRQIMSHPVKAEGDWLSLFNGRNLDGWTPKIRHYPAGDNFGSTFRVVDGTLTVSYDGYDEFDNRFGHLFHDTPYSYYILSLEYKFNGAQVTGGPGWAFENSGVMAHSHSAENMGLDQDFPISLEVQLLGGTGHKERPTGNLCTPGTHVHIDGRLEEEHCINSTSPTYPGNEWVRLDLLVLGHEQLVHTINGETVMSYTRPVVGGGVVSGFLSEQKVDGTLITGGYFSLQSESHPLQFRNIRLLNLVGCMNAGDANYREYLVKHQEDACVSESIGQSSY